jgi:hypothetical protein
VHFFVVIKKQICNKNYIQLRLKLAYQKFRITFIVITQTRNPNDAHP